MAPPERPRRPPHLATAATGAARPHRCKRYAAAAGELPPPLLFGDEPEPDDEDEDGVDDVEDDDEDEEEEDELSVELALELLPPALEPDDDRLSVR